MTEVINAVFKNGVFRPLEKIEMKEHEKVIIKILSLDQWQTGFNRVIEKIHKSMKGSGFRDNTGGRAWDVILSMQSSKTVN